jgi:hypothetical protein
MEVKMLLPTRLRVVEILGEDQVKLECRVKQERRVLARQFIHKISWY